METQHNRQQLTQGYPLYYTLLYSTALLSIPLYSTLFSCTHSTPFLEGPNSVEKLSDSEMFYIGFRYSNYLFFL